MKLSFKKVVFSQKELRVTRNLATIYHREKNKSFLLRQIFGRFYPNWLLFGCSSMSSTDWDTFHHSRHRLVSVADTCYPVRGRLTSA